MTHPSSSKRSMALQAADAADCDEQEQCLQQAAVELHQECHDSICKAALAHNIPKSTLQAHLSGTPPKKDTQAGQQSLTPAAESALVKHIQHCTYSGFPLMLVHICEYANTISCHLTGHVDPVNVRCNWVQGFLL